MAAAVEVAPFPANEPAEIEPGRAAQMRRIAHQLGAFEYFGEQGFAEADRGRLVGLVKALRLERVLGRLDDEGRSILVELVDVRLKPTVLGAAEIEGEGVVALVG